MKLARRGFLKAMGAAPMAAKATAEKLAMQASGIGVIGAGKQASPIVGQDMAGEGRRKLRDWLKLRGIPQWKKDQVWQNVKYSMALDPDIATMKSFSLTQKVHSQRIRDYHRVLQEIESGITREDVLEEFESTTGFSRWDF